MALGAAVVTAALAEAQSLDESVTVEGTYKPNVIQADRLPLVPDLLQFAAPENRMQFDQNSVAASFSPDALTMPSTDWRVRKNYSDTRGYLDFRLGSWLNSTLSAGYAPIRNDDTMLNVWLQHNSTSLWKQKYSNPTLSKRFRYDETLGADLTRMFSNAGRLNADLRYHLGYFNYYFSYPLANSTDGKAPTQTLNDASLSLKWQGVRYGKLTYSADADVRYFGYRRMYTLQNPEYMISSILTLPIIEASRPERETTVNVGGNMEYQIGGASSLQVGLRYSGVLNSLGKNVNRIQFMPAYYYSTGNTRLKVSANLAAVDSKFRVAPDVVLTATSGIVAFKAAVEGGTHLRTLAWMHDMDYYSDPSAGCHLAAYTPIDASLAFQLNPGGRWTAGIRGSWSTTTDETLGRSYASNIRIGMSPSYTITKLHGFSLALNAGYEFCKEFSLSGNASWQPQHGTTGVLNGFDRPELTAAVIADIRPIEKLNVGLGYNLRSHRELYLNSLNLINLNADYRITDRISIGVELNNLLNSKDEILPAIGLEGFNFAVGAQLTF